jgi:CPA1 family monovalent cation:H+ antiporter
METTGIVLILATLALPHALRGLDLPDESPHHQAAEDQARLLAAETADAYRYAIAAAKLVDRYRQRIDRYGGADDAALRSENDEIERQLRLVGLRAERGEILRIGRSRGIDDTRLRKIVRELDLQEARYGG